MTTHPDVPTRPGRKVQLMVTGCVLLATSTFKMLFTEAVGIGYSDC